MFHLCAVTQTVAVSWCLKILFYGEVELKSTCLKTRFRHADIFRKQVQFTIEGFFNATVR